VKSPGKYEKSTRFLCACLSPMDNAAELEQMLPRGEEAWVNILAVNILALSNSFLLTPALFVSLRDKGVLGTLDAKLAGFLGELYQCNERRNQHLLKQMHTVARLLNAQGIEPVLLKGIGALAENLFGDQGSRSMFDIDLLVAEDQLQIASQTLMGAGYFSTNDHYDLDPHHLPRMFHDDEPAGLELHRTILSRTLFSLLTPSLLIEKSVCVNPWGG